MQCIDREEAIIVALVGHFLPQHFHHTKVHHLGFPSSHRLALSVNYWLSPGTFWELTEHFRNTSVFPKLRHAPIRLHRHTSDHCSNDRGSADVVVSTAPAFGSTFHQYKGFQTDTPGGGGGGGFVASTGFAGGIGGGGGGDVDDDDDDDDGRGVSKKLFSFDGSAIGGGGFFPTSPPTDLASTGNGGATATDVDTFGKNNVVSACLVV